MKPISLRARLRRPSKPMALGIGLALVSATASLIGVGGHLDGGEGSNVDRSRKCSYGDWSGPSAVSNDPSRPNMELASPVVASENGLYFMTLAGPALLSNDFPKPPQTSLLLIGPDGMAVGPPPGDFRYMRPTAIGDVAGRLHVIWAEPTRSGSAAASDGGLRSSPASLWHAVYSPKEGWYPATRIYEQLPTSRPLRWRQDVIGLSFDAMRRLHLVVTRIGMAAMLHLIFSDGVWSESSIPTGGLSAHLALGPGGELYLAAIGQAEPRCGPANNVLFSRSNDGGRTWSRPTEVSALGSHRATKARVFSGADGIVHLLWGQNLSGSLFPEVVRHVESRDGGRIWSSAEDLQLPTGPLATWRAVEDECGTVHVAITMVVAATLGPESRLLYARWSDQWSRVQQLFPEVELRDTELAATGTGTIFLVGTALRSGVLAELNEFELISASLQGDIQSGTREVRRLK